MTTCQLKEFTTTPEFQICHSTTTRCILLQKKNLLFSELLYFNCIVLGFKIVIIFLLSFRAIANGPKSAEQMRDDWCQVHINSTCSCMHLETVLICKLSSMKFIAEFYQTRPFVMECSDAQALVEL